jgi:hypothetical protein
MRLFLSALLLSLLPLIVFVPKSVLPNFCSIMSFSDVHVVLKVDYFLSM